VLVARSRNYAWVDANAVGPSGPPPAGWPPPDLPPPPEDSSVGWIATVADVPLWADADGELIVGTVPIWTTLKQLEPQTGKRLRVEDPYSGAEAWLSAEFAGPIEPPERIEAPGRWWGVSWVDGANLRPDPTTRTLALGEIPARLPIVVTAWVAGEEVIKDNPTWAQLADGVYVYSSVVRPATIPTAPTPPSSAAGETGRWLDLNLTHQAVVAYEGAEPTRLMRTSTGRPDWETTPGTYWIQRRVEKETMESNTLLGLDAERANYKVENVRWTQYFSSDGKALHENYWKPPEEIGIPSSHGCAGLVAEDALFLWEWATVGTPLYVHY
jgi:lipoprotein-anchoring transpeptidase ErfK/SrfK